METAGREGGGRAGQGHQEPVDSGVWVEVGTARRLSNDSFFCTPALHWSLGGRYGCAERDSFSRPLAALKSPAGSRRPIGDSRRLRGFQSLSAQRVSGFRGSWGSPAGLGRLQGGKECLRGTGMLPRARETPKDLGGLQRFGRGFSQPAELWPVLGAPVDGSVEGVHLVSKVPGSPRADLSSSALLRFQRHPA